MDFFSKSNKQKKIVFVVVLKVNDENSKIRIRIHYAEARIRGSIRIRTKMSRIRNTDWFIVDPLDKDSEYNIDIKTTMVYFVIQP